MAGILLALVIDLRTVTSPREVQLHTCSSARLTRNLGDRLILIRRRRRLLFLRLGWVLAFLLLFLLQLFLFLRVLFLQLLRLRLVLLLDLLFLGRIRLLLG